MPSKSGLSKQYKNLRIPNEIKPLLVRYDIQYNDKDNKDTLLKLLRANGVPLDRVKLNPNPPDLETLQVLGLEQIALDYPNEISNKSPGNGSDDGPSGGSDNGMDDNTSGSPGDGPGDGSSGGSGDGMDVDTRSGSGDGSSDGPSPGLGSDSSSAMTRSIRRLANLSDRKDHADQAKEAGIPDPADKLTGLERQLLLEYPAASACLPTIMRGLGHAKHKQKVTDLVDWFASVAKSQRIPVGPALAFFDSYLSSPELDFVAYLLDKDGCREGWYGQANNPGARKQAAKRLDNLWQLALESAEMAQTSTTTTVTATEDFFMQVTDPYDNMPIDGKVLGVHMTKKNTLAVRLPSVSNEFPDLGRGLWVVCKSGKELEDYERYVKQFPTTGKLISADESLLGGCKTPDDFDLDSVFRMKWGKAYHTYGYGRSKKGGLSPQLMFSKTALSKALTGTAAVAMLQKHRDKTGQAVYEGGGEAHFEAITLRAKRRVLVK